MSRESNLKLEIKCTELENVKALINIISSDIKQAGVISEYNSKLLNALLGEDWELEYSIGE